MLRSLVRPMSQPDLEQANLLDLEPVPTAHWSEVEGRVVLERPRPRSGGLKGLLERLSHWTASPRIRLDPVGSAVWRLCDGARTVGAVCAAVRREFGEECEPLEERIGLFLGQLREGGFIAYAGWDDDRIARWRAEADARDGELVPDP